jgi:hypothetical protein
LNGLGNLNKEFLPNHPTPAGLLQGHLLNQPPPPCLSCPPLTVLCLHLRDLLDMLTL